MKKTLLCIAFLIYGTLATPQCHSNFIFHPFKQHAVNAFGALWIKGFSTDDYFGNLLAVKTTIQYTIPDTYNPAGMYAAQINAKGTQAVLKFVNSKQT